MRRSSKATPKFSDNTSNPGPGLFINEQDRIGIEAVRKFVIDVIEVQDFEASRQFSRRKRARIEDCIVRFVTYYHSDRDYDARLKFRDMKAEARRLRDVSRRLEKVCATLSRHVVVSIDQEASRLGGCGPEHIEHIEELRAKLKLIEQACTPIATRVIRKAGDVSVDKACLRLWKLRELITGHRFVRQWETARGHASRKGRREFIGPDARFVQALLEIVDPEVTVASIRTGLKRAAVAWPLGQNRTK